jgi:soluble lytic murein transglycosylase-like protein
MPATAQGLGVDPMNPTQAVDGAARMLRGLLGEFGSVDLALAAYNAGPGAVHRYGGIPPYAETRRYVPAVRAYQQQLENA